MRCYVLYLLLQISKQLIVHAGQVASLNANTNQEQSIGADFDGTMTLAGVDSVADYPKLIQAVMARGATDEQVRKLAGENILRYELLSKSRIQSGSVRMENQGHSY